MNSVELKETILEQYNEANKICEDYIKETEQLKQNSIEDLKGYEIRNARKYGQRIQCINGIYTVKNEQANELLKEYEQRIQEFKRIHDEKFNLLMAIEQELEKKLINSYIKQINEENSTMVLKNELEEGRKELAKLAINADIEEIEIRVQELKEKSNKLQEEIYGSQSNIDEMQKEEVKIKKAINKCKKEIEQHKQKTNENMLLEKALRNDRFHNINEKYLIIAKPEGTFKRTINYISNIFSGRKRFENEILKPLEAGINNLKGNKIEDLRKQINKETEELIVYIEKRTHVNKTNSEIEEISKQDYITILENATKEKEKLVNSIIDTQEEKEVKGA